MKILICYSKSHFDPSTKVCLTHSAAFIAKAIYESCKELGDVTYIDPSEYDSVRGQTFDLFVGQISRFSKIHQSIQVKYSILFMATTHPANRNRVLGEEARRLGVPLSETLNFEKDSFKFADLILQIGSDWALQALLDNHIDRSKILNIHYGVQHIPFTFRKNFSKPYRFLFLATELGLRKGITHLLEAFTGLDDEYELTLAGKINGPKFEHQIFEAISKNDRIRYAGWIESDTEEYLKLLANHNFIIFPSLEDVEAGTVLEGLSSGLIPITTGERVGIDYSPLGIFMLHSDNTALLKQAMSLSPGDINMLSKQAHHYVESIHNWDSFKLRLKEIFFNILDGHLRELTRPKVSLILPVFNKEETIVRLLQQFYRTTRSYQNYELHIFFDGCIDRSREKAEKYLSRCSMDVKYYETPNLFETRTNNIGLHTANGKYCVLLQDDTFLYEEHWLEKFVYFMETNPRVGALGGLAGVNFYPSDVVLNGLGTTSHNIEKSQRIDMLFDHDLYKNIHEVDAVMRGPLMLRKSLLEEFGYLDEENFAPFYQDDMDLCFRLRENGYSVFYYPIDVVNEGLSVRKFDKEKSSRWHTVVDYHLRLFYEHWQPKRDKSYYLKLSKPKFNNLYHPTNKISKLHTITYNRKSKKPSKMTEYLHFFRKTLNIFDNNYCMSLSDQKWKKGVLWTQEQIAFIPAGTKVLDVGAGTAPYRLNCSHCEYITQDLAQTPNFQYGKIDIVSDSSAIPVENESFDVVLCTEVLEHVSDPIGTLREIGRILRPNGKLILTAPLGSGLHQLPYHYYGGFTRHFYEKYLPESGLNIVSIEANGGLFGHLVEMNGTRAFPLITGFTEKVGWLPRHLLQPVIQLLLQNIPAVAYSILEDLKIIEDFTVGYHVIAEKYTQK